MQALKTGSLMLRRDDPNENDDDLIAYRKGIKKMLENEYLMVKGRMLIKRKYKWYIDGFIIRAESRE